MERLSIQLYILIKNVFCSYLPAITESMQIINLLQIPKTIGIAKNLSDAPQ